MNAIELIDRFRNNEQLSHDELNMLLAWLLSDEGKARFQDEISKRWAAFETKAQWDYDAMLHTIHQCINTVPVRRPFHRYIRYAIEVAAVVVLAIGISFFLKNDHRSPATPGASKALAEQVEIYNPKGLRTTITLPDSSRVMLNADSKIIYAHHFEGDTRTVKLEGEAFFEVAKNAQKPFIVEANEAKMIVHGTSFNVRSYPADKFIETTLVEGSLTVDAGADKQLLEPGKQCSISKASKKSSVQTVNPTVATAWMEGKFYFKANTFVEITAVLERAFNVNIRVENQALLQKKLTGKFENGENLGQILQVLRLSVAFSDSYNKETNTIEII